MTHHLSVPQQHNLPIHWNNCPRASDIAQVSGENTVSLLDKKSLHNSCYADFISTHRVFNAKVAEAQRSQRKTLKTLRSLRLCALCVYDTPICQHHNNTTSQYTGTIARELLILLKFQAKILPACIGGQCPPYEIIHSTMLAARLR